MWIYLTLDHATKCIQACLLLAFPAFRLTFKGRYIRIYSNFTQGSNY